MALAKAEYDISAAAVASLADGEASAAAGMEVAAEGGTHAGTVLNSLKAPNFGGGGGQAQPKATGMDYVPYDDYYARLHKGEAVLTRAEATIWRKGASNGFTSYNEHNNVYVGTMNMANDYSPNELMNNLAAYQRRRNAGYGM